MAPKPCHAGNPAKRKATMALHESDIPFEGTTIHCWEGGSGFPILMLHGSGAGASTPGNWRRVIDPLSTKYRVLAADLIGFGLSGRKKEQRSEERRVGKEGRW